MKILVIGCSYSACTDRHHENSVPIYWEYCWPKQLQQLGDYEIVNVSYSGADIDILALLLREKLEDVNPDLVLFQITSCLRKAHSSFRVGRFRVTDFMPMIGPVPGFEYLPQAEYDIFSKLPSIYTERVLGERTDIPPIVVGNMAEWLYNIMGSIDNSSYMSYDKSEFMIRLFDMMLDDIGSDQTFSDLQDQSTETTRLYEMIGAKKYINAASMLTEQRTSYATIVEGARYFCEKRGYPSMFFDWLPDRERAKTDVVAINQGASLLDRDLVEFNIYESIPQLEMYAVDIEMHLDPHGHKLVAELINGKIKNANTR